MPWSKSIQISNICNISSFIYTSKIYVVIRKSSYFGYVVVK